MHLQNHLKYFLIFTLLLLVGCQSNEEHVISLSQTTSTSFVKTISSVTLPEVPLPYIPPTPLELPIFPKGSPAALHGALHLEGTILTDEYGSPFLLHGISTHGVQWFDKYVNVDCFKTLKDEWGANVIRLALYTDENSGYAENKTSLHELVEEGIEIASNLGLYVIVDWHILSDGNPNIHLTEAEHFFDYFSTKYQNYPNVLFEICNEPNGNDVKWDEQIKPYAEQIISIIRQHSPKSLIIVGTPNWCQNLLSIARNPLKDNAVLYAYHFYANSHTTVAREHLNTAVTVHKLPVFVSEFGTCDATGTGTINTEQSDLWLDLLDSLQVSWVNWSLCDKAETSALLNPNANIKGSWSDYELTQSGLYIKNKLLSLKES